MEQQSKAHKGMDFLSKKMGAAGVFIGWLLYMCTEPDKIRVILASIITVLFIAATIWRNYIKAKYNPESLEMQKSFRERISAALAMTSGYVGALLGSNIGMEWKMWGCFVVVVVFLIAQGVFDTLTAKIPPKKVPSAFKTAQ